MKLEEAIKKAIEGGWSINLPSHSDFNKFKSFNGYWIVLECSETVEVEDKNTGKITKEPIITSITLEKLLLDPKFWQYLGKSLGWREHSEFIGEEKDTTMGHIRAYKNQAEWLYQWHKFIDNLAEGRTVVDFFEKLE